MADFPIELQAARIVLSRSHPYLSAALWRLQHAGAISDMGPRLAVDDKWRLYADPVRIKERSVGELSIALYHEILHLLRRHPNRCVGMHVTSEELDIWRIACDLEVNDDLKGEGLSIPDWYILPSKFGFEDGELVEKYYHDLIDNAIVINVSSMNNEIGNGNCGSCATGKREEWELEGENEDAPGVSPIEAEVVRQGVAKAVQEHKKSRGTVPAHLDRWSEGFLSPTKVPWQRELAAHIKKSLSTMAGRVDYTYTRPSRRQSAFGKVVMPSMRQPSPKVGVVIDTSGSMGTQDLEDALSEVKGILMSIGQRNGVEVMSVDAAVHTAQKVFSVRQVKVVGGGGTDMREGLRAMGEKRLGVVVVLTDGHTPWPAERCSFDVIVALVGIGYNDNVPSWARKVVVE